MGRPEEAIEAFQQAVALNYRYSRPYNGLGNVYRTQGQFERARQLYERAAELDSGYAAPYCALGTILALQGEFRPAIVAYQKAIARDPRDPLAYCGLAALYNRACYAAVAGQRRQALDLLDEALHRTPGLRGWARQDPDFASLHEDPEFRNVVGAGDPALNSTAD